MSQSPYHVSDNEHQWSLYASVLQQEEEMNGAANGWKNTDTWKLWGK